jgi:hypothetical protein
MMIPPQRFELPEKWEHIPVLEERVQKLVEDDRYRSALDEVLRHLRHDPSSTAAMILAVIVFSQTRTESLSTPESESLIDLQTQSALLAPIATECSVCQGVWYSKHTLMRGVNLIITNPRGLQCQGCRYTMCRECLKRGNLLVDSRHQCPVPGSQGTLTTPVLPTGRHDVSPVDPDSIERVIVVREGPVAPSTEEALMVVTKFVPLLPDDLPLIRSCSGGRGMNDEFTRNQMALSLVQDFERDGELAPGAWNRSRRVFVRAGVATDTDYLITVVRKPDSAIQTAKLSPWRRLWHRISAVQPPDSTSTPD